MRLHERFGRQASGRLTVAALLVALVAGALVGPFVYRHYLTSSGARAIHDLGTLPASIHTCGRTFARSRWPPRTFSEARSADGSDPVLIDPVPFSHCPEDWCRGDACHTVVWVRVGPEEVVAYSLRGGP